MSNLVVGSTLKEFFRMLVGEVVNRQKVSLAEVTEFYVVNLLSEFAAPDSFALSSAKNGEAHRPRRCQPAVGEACVRSGLNRPARRLPA